jgi:LysM repeat protein
MTAEKKSNLQGKRNFRLAPLELLVLSLIVVGIIYLMTMWFSGSGHSAPQAVSPVKAPAKQLEKTLMAYEKVQARLGEVEKRLSDIDCKLDNLAKAENPTTKDGKPLKLDKSGKYLSRRIAELEGKVDSLAKNNHGSKDLAVIKGSLGKLKKDQAQTDKALNAKLAKIEKALNEQDKAAESNLGKRLAKLEKTIQEQKAGHFVKAPMPDDEVLARLEKLEKNLAKAGDKPADLEKRLAALDGKMSGLAKKLENLGKQDIEDQKQVEDTPEEAKAVEPEQEKPAQVEKKATAETQAPAKVTPKITTEPPKPQARAGTGEMKIHTIRRGDTLFALARRYKVTVRDLKNWNPQLKRRRYLWLGEKLIVNPGS